MNSRDLLAIPGTRITVTLTSENIQPLLTLLSGLCSAGHRGLYFNKNADSNAVNIVITNQARSQKFDLSYFDELVGKLLPGSNATEISAGYFGVNTFTPFIDLLNKMLLTVKTSSDLVVNVVNSVLRSRSLIEELNNEKLKAWKEANKPRDKSDDEDEFGFHTSFVNLGMKPSRPHHPTHHFFGGSSHHGDQPSFFDQMERDRRKQTERNNAEIMFDIELREMKAQFHTDYICKVESLMIAADSLVSDIINNQLTTPKAIYERWKNFTSDGEIGKPTVENLISRTNRAEITVKIDEEAVRMMRFASNGNEIYYSDVKAYFKEVIRMVLTDGRPYNTSCSFSPSTQDEAMLQIADIFVPYEGCASFIFDLQCALLSTGLMDKFTLAIAFSRDAQRVFKAEIAHLVQVYSLKDDSYESLEKCLRSAVFNDHDIVVTFLLENIPINIDSQDTNPNNRYTALHHAVIKRRPAFIKQLLQHGAKVDIQAASGETAMSLANKEDQLPEIKALIPLLPAAAVNAEISEVSVTSSLNKLSFK